ncbi:MBL fold metallo-hydrolase [Marasmitruncus massiliensis]|uniref:MBL fold metallo-hydrolase n=1 Tax=Marasmitruncus massiliensis TaxID=1944642 RepID=UPI000C7DEB75|nr:MBL fold metallo-hydrolase [Marasmitruncus massiliensis]
MARFCSLFSGSSGNSTYISSSDTAILIDAGRSCKQLLEAMQAREIDPKSIRAILVTHEHTDHISGLRVLLKKLKIPVFASAEVLQKLDWDHLLESEADVRPLEGGTRFTVGSLEIDSFDTPHDSVHSFGYRVSTPDGRRLIVATDMGYIRENVREMLTGCDLVMLESNYDQRMLSASDYPYYLKQRIASNLGHLSNEDCSEELIRLVRTGSTRFILGHLSQNNNLPELAYQTAYSNFELHGMREGVDYTLQVAPRSKPSEMVVL